MTFGYAVQRERLPKISAQYANLQVMTGYFGGQLQNASDIIAPGCDGFSMNFATFCRELPSWHQSIVDKVSGSFDQASKAIANAEQGYSAQEAQTTHAVNNVPA